MLKNAAKATTLIVKKPKMMLLAQLLLLKCTGNAPSVIRGQGQDWSERLT